MSNIIKSKVVVDERPEPDQIIWYPDDKARPVIKKQGVTGPATILKGRALPTKDALQDELNRIRLEIDEVQKELRLAKRELDDTNRTVAGLREQEKSLEHLSGLTPDDQARAIVLEAEAKAEQMIEWAKQQAAESIDQLKAQGYLDGLEQGANEARARFNQEHEPDIHKLEQLMEGLSSMKDELISENENDIISLIITVAERVIGKSLQDDPKVVVDMLHEVLEQNRRESFVKVTLSPDLLPAQAKVSDSIRKAIKEIGQQIDVAIDAEAAPGTMLVETPGGFTDLSVQTQLENLHDVLLEE